MNDLAPILDATDLGKRIGARDVLRDIRVRLAPGDVVGVLGKRSESASCRSRTTSSARSPAAASSP